MRVSIAVEHCIHESERSFDEIVAAFEAATGSVEEGFETVARDVTDAASFEATFRAREGSSGFMRFACIDHGRWIKLFGIGGKSLLYILGNPLIARTMIRHDIGVGLYVPVRLAIEQTADAKVRVRYDRPSTLMSGLGNAEVTEAAQILDAKLADLAEDITGAPA